MAFIGNGYFPAELTAVGNRLFFVGDDSQGAELWVSDGSAIGTRRVLDINPTADASAPGPHRGPTQLTAVNNRTVYFSADDGSSGYELWTSDGSASGTTRVMDLNPGPDSSHPRDLIVRGNILYFTASDSFNGRQLWATDILANTTTRLTSAEMFGSSTQFSVQERGNDRNLAIAGDTLFFSAYFRHGPSISGYELWGLDLPPLVSLTLPPGGDGEPLSEEGPRALPVLFQRTGDTTSALTVTFQVGGTARLGSDYRVREAASFTASAGSVTFAAGSSTAILLLDPIPDGVGEGNETVSLTLTSGSGYAVESGAAVVATLVDNDLSSGRVAGTAIPARLASGSVFEHRNPFAFAAVKRDGSVVTWGDASTGGNSTAVAARLAAGVRRVFSTTSAFAALKSDGSVVAWGDPLFGGDASVVGGALSFGVTEIASTALAFAARKSDGSVITWGDSRFGNFGGDSSAVRAQLASGVEQVFASRGAFAALKSDGSVVPWGDAAFGGVSAPAAPLLASGVVTITPGEAAFAALKSDGSVVAWGDPSVGGSVSPGIATELASGVVRVFSNPHAFAALKSDEPIPLREVRDERNVASAPARSSRRSRAMAPSSPGATLSSGATRARPRPG